MHGNLFVKTHAQYDLRSFAAAVFGLLNVASPSTRESENYADGEYVIGQVLGVAVKIAVADDSEFPDYQFWINFKPSKAWVEEPSWFDGLADLVAKQLALDGHDVARALAFGKVGGAKVLYSRKSSAGSVRDQLEICRVD
jgi:hypothetical protein